MAVVMIPNPHSQSLTVIVAESYSPWVYGVTVGWISPVRFDKKGVPRFKNLTGPTLVRAVRGGRDGRLVIPNSALLISSNSELGPISTVSRYRTGFGSQKPRPIKPDSSATQRGLYLKEQVRQSMELVEVRPWGGILAMLSPESEEFPYACPVACKNWE